MTTAAQAALSVSRETSDALALYAGEVRKWNSQINLISKSTEEVLWERHIQDSAQLMKFLRPSDKIWADLGSGAGFPGLVIAIIAKYSRPDLKVILIEKDGRKAEFLRHVSRLTNTQAEIAVARIEDLDPIGANIVSARALAPVNNLLSLAVSHLKPTGCCLFLKGRSAESELTAARAFWHMKVTRFPSHSSSEGTILKIEEIRHV